MHRRIAGQLHLALVNREGDGVGRAGAGSNPNLPRVPVFRPRHVHRRWREDQGQLLRGERIALECRPAHGDGGAGEGAFGGRAVPALVADREDAVGHPRELLDRRVLAEQEGQAAELHALNGQLLFEVRPLVLEDIVLADVRLAGDAQLARRRVAHLAGNVEHVLDRLVDVRNLHYACDRREVKRLTLDVVFVGRAAVHQVKLAADVGEPGRAGLALCLRTRGGTGELGKIDLALGVPAEQEVQSFDRHVPQPQVPAQRIEEGQLGREPRQLDDLHARLVENLHATDRDRAPPAEGPVGDLDPAFQALVDLSDDERASRSGAQQRRGQDHQQDKEDQ